MHLEPSNKLLQKANVHPCIAKDEATTVHPKQRRSWTVARSRKENLNTLCDLDALSREASESPAEDWEYYLQDPPPRLGANTIREDSSHTCQIRVERDCHGSFDQSVVTEVERSSRRDSRHRSATDWT